MKRTGTNTFLLIATCILTWSVQNILVSAVHEVFDPTLPQPGDCSGTGEECTGTAPGGTCSCRSGYYLDGTECKQRCGGRLSQPTGSLSSPNYPNIYSNNQNCVWTIVVSAGKRIFLNFIIFGLELETQCNYDYIEIRNGVSSNSPLIGKYCGSTAPTNIISHSNQMYIMFKTDVSNTYEGFMLYYESTSAGCGGRLSQSTGSLSSPNYPNMYSDNQYCVWTIVVPAGKRIFLNFIIFGLEPEPQCNYDYIEIRNGVSRTSSLIGKYCGSAAPSNIISHSNQMYIMFKTDGSNTYEGFMLHYGSKSAGCGGRLTYSTGSLSSPNYPNMYSNNQCCVWTIVMPAGKWIFVNFTHFRLEHESNCTYDYIEIRNGVSSNSPLIGKYCGSAAPSNMISHSNQMYIMFKTDVSVTYEGFMLHYESTSGCGGRLTNSTGYLSSPNYPHKYSNNQCCVWTIVIPAGKRIFLNFNLFHLENASNCTLDYIEIRNGVSSNSPLIGKYCGSAAPSNIISHSNQMHIMFKTDGSVTYEGFIIHYESTSEIEYGQSCSSNGTCREANINCYSDECRCNPGFYRATQICLKNVNLKPQNVVSQSSSMTEISVNWNTSASTTFANGYELDVTPSVSSGNIVIIGTTATLSSLTPGMKYYITVKTNINYLNRDERAAAGQVTQATAPAKTNGRAPATNLTAPDIQIWFYKADGVAQSYAVRLQGISPDPYDVTRQVRQTVDTILAEFPNTVAGRRYSLYITTLSNDLTSEPFIEVIRVNVKQAGAVYQLKAEDVTSRSSLVTWQRPQQPNGDILEYILEVLANLVCLQKVIFNCSECSREGYRVNETSTFECASISVHTISQTNIENGHYRLSHNLTELLPDTYYTVTVVASNEEGQGIPISTYSRTHQEAAEIPNNFNSPSQTSCSILLTWTPPIPRPGTTTYTIVVYERVEDSQNYEAKYATNITGYEESNMNITGLSSYWDYRFTLMAFTIIGESEIVQISHIRTKESTPIEVGNLEIKPLQNVFDQVQLSWECPKMKDGRNGEIISGTVISKAETDFHDVTPVEGTSVFPATSQCSWSVNISVTPECNYTFQVYVSNKFDGTSTTIERNIPGGPPFFPSPPVTLLNSGKTSAVLKVCGQCVLNNRNGRILKTGIVICKIGSCPTGDESEIVNEDYYENLPNWNTALGNGFNSFYRPTSNDWLSGDQNETIVSYALGSETCLAEDQNRYCNGPLPVDNTYRARIFACTRTGCNESNYIDISLNAKEKSFPLTTIGAIVGAVLAFLIICVIVTVVCCRGTKPRSRNTSSTKRSATRDQKEDIYEEIAVQRLSEISTLPRSDNIYDDLAAYSNIDVHVYGKINVTKT